MEFLEASAFAACVSCIYVLPMEWASSKYRTVGTTVVAVSYSISGILFGFIGLYEHNFRILLRIFYIPGLLSVLYILVLPESIRWLFVTGRIDRGITTLKRIAKWNRRELSNQTIASLQQKYSKKDTQNADPIMVEKKSIFQLLWTILKTKTLGIRFAHCILQWAASGFIYYGLSQSATQIPGTNRYVGFMIITAIEIPGKLVCQPLLAHFKRKIILFVAFIISALSVFAPSLIPTEYSWAVLFCFAVGKCATATAFNSLYVYTTELWPTSIRISIVNSCSMFARVGSMMAPMVLILVNIFYFSI